MIIWYSVQCNFFQKENLFVSSVLVLLLIVPLSSCERDVDDRCGYVHLDNIMKLKSSLSLVQQGYY